jgi:hypothetical protein
MVTTRFEGCNTSGVVSSFVQPRNETKTNKILSFFILKKNKNG